MIRNALSIDVEDYYMVSAFADVVKFEDWSRYESRVEKNTRKILDLLDEYNVKATFFVLGWVSEHYPKLIQDIHKRGHEVACHGYNHRLVYDLSAKEFKEDTRKAKILIEDAIGVAVKGYRAASYSIVKQSLWAIDILIEEGFVYDSSIFPIYHDRYGYPEAERFPHFIKGSNGILKEFPLSTYSIFGYNVPIAGGGYFRLFPLWAIIAAIRKINVQEKKPVIFYFHPWEIDSLQPKINGRWLSQMRHHMKLDSTLPKLRILLDKTNFKPLSEFLSEE